MSKDKRLGRGLEALLGRAALEVQQLETQQGEAGQPATVVEERGTDQQPEAAASEPTVRISEVDRNPYQPRQIFDEEELAAMADSLQAHGLLQPILVRRIDDRYQLIAGERRLRAAIKAGWSEVPARIIDVDDRQMAEVAIIENLQRRDLDPLEKAASFQRYLHSYRCKQDELAARLSIDRSTIANLIRLLELPDDVQHAVRTGAITQGHARALLPLGDEAEQIAFCRRIGREGLSVRDTEALVAETIESADAEPLAIAGHGSLPPESSSRSQHLAALEEEFRMALGTKVDLKQSGRGRGKIIIHFKNHDEFDRLRDFLIGEEVPAQYGNVG